MNTSLRKFKFCHEPININSIESIHLWSYGKGIKLVPKEEYMYLVEWFNEYDSKKIARTKNPKEVEAQIIFTLKTNELIILHYKNETVYVTAGVKNNRFNYYRLTEDSPQLESFFKNLIKVQ